MYNTEEKIKGRQWMVPGVHKKLGNFFILDLQCDATHLLGLAERRPNVIDQKMVNKKVYYYISAPNSNSILGALFSFEIKWLAEKLWAKDPNLKTSVGVFITVLLATIFNKVSMV